PHSWLLLVRSFCFSPVPAPAALYTLSLHDALPICTQRLHATATHLEAATAGINGLIEDNRSDIAAFTQQGLPQLGRTLESAQGADRKSTRLNSSHVKSHYPVFCVTRITRSRLGRRI